MEPIPLADVGWIDALVRTLVAAGLGGLLGAEREADGQEAGLRTHVLLAVGSALFGMMSVGAFDGFATAGESNFTVDPTRIASYVAAGIGFLGGGAILKYGGTVRGLTTAASIWASAAIGLAAGVGFIAPAVVVTGVALVSLSALRPARTLLARLGRGGSTRVVARVDRPEAAAGLVRDVDRIAGRLPERVTITNGEPGEPTEVRIELSDGSIAARVLEALPGRPGVISVSVTGPGGETGGRPPAHRQG